VASCRRGFPEESLGQRKRQNRRQTPRCRIPARRKNAREAAAAELERFAALEVRHRRWMDSACEKEVLMSFGVLFLVRKRRGGVFVDGK
jgi:hypothetical protein